MGFKGQIIQTVILSSWHYLMIPGFLFFFFLAKNKSKCLLTKNFKSLLLALFCRDKIPEKNNLGKKRFSLAYIFRGSSPRSAGYIALGLRLRQRASWLGRCGEAKLHIWPSGTTKGNGGGGSEGQAIVLKGMLPRTHSHQLGSTYYSFHHLPIIHSNYDYINGLIH